MGVGGLGPGESEIEIGNLHGQQPTDGESIGHVVCGNEDHMIIPLDGGALSGDEPSGLRDPIGLIGRVSGKRMSHGSLKASPVVIHTHQGSGEPRVIQKTTWREDLRAAKEGVYSFFLSMSCVVKIALGIGLTPDQKEILKSISKEVDFETEHKIPIDLKQLCHKIADSSEESVVRANLLAFEELFHNNQDLLNHILGEKRARHLVMTIGFEFKLPSSSSE